jgi:hypothetical protein
MKRLIGALSRGIERIAVVVSHVFSLGHGVLQILFGDEMTARTLC